MQAHKVFRVLAALLLTLALAATAQAAPQRHNLPGGLTLITSENHEAPVVAFQVWVRAGSAYENANERGMTHLIEHMIFKGTPKDPEGTMARRIEGLGGDVNAYTTIDHTNYYVVAASRNAHEALTLLADAVVHASFDAGELKKEKEVVVEEIRMNQDNPDRRRYKAAFRLAFGDHPYGRPVIGSEKSVRAMTRDDILAYVKRWYRGPGTLVVAVGDFKTAELVPLVKKLFADLSTTKPPAFSLPPRPEAKAPRVQVMTEKVNQAAVMISWPIPGLPHADVYALDMTSTVLGDGATSRLYSRLKEELGLVDSIGAWAHTPEGQGLFTVQAKMPPAKLAKALPAIMAEVMALIKQPPTSEELARARINLSASFIRSRMTMAGQARMLGNFEMFYGGFEQEATYLDRFQGVAPGDVSRAVMRYFLPQGMTVLIQAPAGTVVPSAAELTKAAEQIYAQATVGQDQEADKIVRVKLGQGLTLIVKPQRAVPLVSMVLAAPGGTALEDKQTAGLYQLWSRSVTRGTAQHSYEELTRILEDMAGSLDAFSGKSAAGLSADFLARDWQKGLGLLAEVWLSPNFPRAQVDRAKAEQFAALRSQKDNPAALAFKRLRPLIYGQDNPYGLNYLGTEETLKAMTPSTLQKAHQRIMGPGGVVLSVVGDVDPATVVAEVKRLFKGKAGAVALPGIKLPAPHNQPVVKAYTEAKAKQTQIVLAFLAPNATDPQRLPLLVLESIVGGMGGSLFTDLRDKRSLAYSVQPFYSPSRWGSSFGVYMAVGPGKEKAALDGLNEHLTAARTRAPSAAEMKRAKGYMLGDLAIGLQSYGAQANVMANNELLGLGFDYHLRLPQAIEAVTAEQVLAAAKKYLDPKHRIQLTQGPVPGRP